MKLGEDVGVVPADPFLCLLLDAVLPGGDEVEVYACACVCVCVCVYV